MEELCVLGCALLTGLGAFMVMSPDGMPPAGGRRLRWQRAWTRTRRCLAALAGLHVMRALNGTSAWRDLSGLLRLLVRERGLEVTSEEAGAALALLCLGLSLVGGIASSSVVGIVAMGGLCALGVIVFHSSRERKREREVAESMPGVFRTLAVALGSGQTLAQAIEYVGSHESGPVARAFTRVSLRLRCGVGVKEALTQMADELAAPGVGLLVTALLISQRTGSPLRDLFQRSAQLVERQGELQRTLAVKTAQVRLSVRIVCLMPLLMIAVLTLISPDFQSGVTSPVGALCVIVALAMDGAALLIIRRLLRGVL